MKVATKKENMKEFSVGQAQRAQFKRDGYFLLENAIPFAQLERLRGEAQRFRAQMDAEMEQRGVTKLGITHKDNRYFIANRFRESAVLRDFLFSNTMAEICRATLGQTAYLFNEQFVLKAAERGMAFGWHQDSGYIGFSHRPYLSCWCALDDMTIENGTVRVLTYKQAGTRDWVTHAQEKETGDMIGYRGEEEGMPALIKAGGIVVFSSTVFHRSGVNITDQMRRVYLAQYSTEPILKPDGKTLWGNAVPFLEDGAKV
jgi:ectoine hydroxylase-related dioxygenase (phytanoyl-CoA dioxygenase family)